MLYQFGFRHQLPVEAHVIALDIFQMSLPLGIVGDDQEISPDVLPVIEVADMNDIVCLVLVVDMLDRKIVYAELVDPLSEKLAELLVLQLCVCAVVCDLSK